MGISFGYHNSSVFASILIIMLIEFISTLLGITSYQNKKHTNDLLDLIEYHDQATGCFHIVLGDYDQRIEETCDYKVLGIDSGTNFLTALSDAYRNEEPIVIILETIGGDIKSCDIIFRSLLEYPFGVSVYVCNYAFSAGTFISLACKQIFISEWGLLSPTDPQIGHIPESNEFQASSKHFMNLINKDEKISDRMFITSLNAEMYHNENIEYIREALTKHGYEMTNIESIVSHFCSGKYSHERPFNTRMLKEIGLNVSNDIPEYIYDINDEAKKYKC
jgi:hypothetical protein